MEKVKKFYNTDVEEQETIINIDYAKKEAHCYSSRKTQIERLIKKLGEPTQIYYTNKKISGASWVVPFSNKNLMKIIFSKPVIVGSL